MSHGLIFTLSSTDSWGLVKYFISNLIRAWTVGHSLVQESFAIWKESSCKKTKGNDKYLFSFLSTNKNGNCSYVMSCDVAIQVYVIWFDSPVGTWNRNHKCVLFVATLISQKILFVMLDKNLQQSRVCWACPHESLSKSSLLMPNSLFCCWLLFIQLKHVLLVTCGRALQPATSSCFS